jgi:AcrR family transcriptional regulator/DNA-binding MarR family transcriptional regulator
MVAGVSARGGRRAAARQRLGAQGREHVLEVQRQRLLAALADVVAERGLARVTVAHIVARSNVSRRTFYELFEDREVCFLAAFDHAIAQASMTVIPAFAGERGWRERVRAGLTAILAFLDDRPGLGALLVVDALGAGPQALARRAAVLAQLIETVDAGRGERKPAQELPPLTAEGTVGAVLSIVHARLLERNSQPLIELLNPLSSIVVLPYLGAAAARRELTRPTPKAGGPPRRSQTDLLEDLDMRLTYRTVRVLTAIAVQPRASNRRIAELAGVTDQGQISKLLARLSALGLVLNTAVPRKGQPNTWTLTAKGTAVERALGLHTGS